MAENWEERTKAIIQDDSFNNLPYEQRKFISKFLHQHQILTLWQAIHNYPNLICAEYKRKMSRWLHQCVAEYEKYYGKE